MYICLCRDVTEEQIKSAICKGACTEKCLQKKLGVSTQCGQCRSDVQAILKETLVKNENKKSATSDDFVEALCGHPL